MPINPIEIKGNWDKGYVLDVHVISSTSKSENDFETTRTKLGELLYQLKYRGKYEIAGEIISLIKPFFRSFIELKDVNLIIPVPSSKKRDFQPVDELAMAISEYLHVEFSDLILEKISPLQVKNMSKGARNLKGSINAKIKLDKPCNILLVDDLYETGKTLKECVAVLKDDPNINNIYVLAMTKTR